MRRKILAILLILIACFCFVGLTACQEEETKPITSQIVIDKEYKEAYTILMPTTIIINGNPIMITTPHHFSETFTIVVFVTYTDETTETKRITTTSEIYNRTVIGEEWKG